MQTKRRIIAAKIEAAEGTPETLVNADAGVLVTNPTYTPDIKMLPRDVLMATFSKMPDLAGVQLARMTFKAEVIGRGAAYAAGTLPRLSPYLRACGLQETVDATVSAEKVSYQRASANIPSLTMAFLDDNGAGGSVIKMLAGARGTVNFSAATGGQLYADFSFIGSFIEPVDGAQLVASYDDLLPPQLLGAPGTINGVQQTFSSFNLDMGNQLAGIPDCSKASGYRSFEITDGNTRGKIDPEAGTVAAFDYYGHLKTGTLLPLVIGPFGPAQYNQLKITGSNLRITNVQEGDREGKTIYNVDYQLSMDSGDDEFVLEFS